MGSLLHHLRKLGRTKPHPKISPIERLQELGLLVRHVDDSIVSYRYMMGIEANASPITSAQECAESEPSRIYQVYRDPTTSISTLKICKYRLMNTHGIHSIGVLIVMGMTTR